MFTGGVTGLAAFALLADGRFPSGGHAHSGGLEAAVRSGRVSGLSELAGFLRIRLATTGLVSAAFAAAACAHSMGARDRGTPACLEDLEAGLDARTPSPALRLASRRQGRALVRAARVVWPTPSLDALTSQAGGPHYPVALGVVSAVAGLTPDRAALLAAHHAVAGPASAAVRLLNLDPYAVHAVLARLGPACEQTAVDAVSYLGAPVRELPAASAPLLDIGAQAHAGWEVRLFAS